MRVGRMSSIIALRMIRALVRLGWTEQPSKSTSHRALTKLGHRPITIPLHKGRTLKEGTARAILKAAGVDEDDFFAAY